MTLPKRAIGCAVGHAASLYPIARARWHQTMHIPWKKPDHLRVNDQSHQRATEHPVAWTQMRREAHPPVRHPLRVSSLLTRIRHPNPAPCFSIFCPMTALRICFRSRPPTVLVFAAIAVKPAPLALTHPPGNTSTTTHATPRHSFTYLDRPLLVLLPLPPPLR